MKLEEKKQVFKMVFAPKPGEKLLFLIDIPHDNLNDSDSWVERREMAQEWYKIFKEMSAESGFTVNMLEYEATGMHNGPIPQEIIDSAKKSNLVLAMTEYSASSSLLLICLAKDSITRCASMPGIERRMEKITFKTDYSKVASYAMALEKMLNGAVGAEILFSTGDTLYIDLRNRVAGSGKGNCTKNGQFINIPSGEGCIAPYEAATEETNEFGESKSEGIWPVIYDGELVKYVIKNNRIAEIIGDGKKAKEMSSFFAENDTRRNIAELGIGCNPQAVVTGNVLEDEKVGLHIAYGMSTHIAGKVKSDMHQDICYSRGCPVEGTTLTLINADRTKTELIRDAMLRYDLLK